MRDGSEGKPLGPFRVGELLRTEGSQGGSLRLTFSYPAQSLKKENALRWENEERLQLFYSLSLLSEVEAGILERE